MPTIVTRGAASARGYGYSGNLIYRVETLLQNTTWTAPAGVTSIATVTGKGQDGAAGYWKDFVPGTLYNEPQQVMMLVNVGYPGSDTAGLNYANTQGAILPTSSSTPPAVYTWRSGRYTASGTLLENQFTALVRVTPGLSRTQIENGWGATWSPPAPQSYAYGFGNLQYYIDPVTGADTTGFGYTFAGGAGGPATAATYNNVPVTPGTTYTITSTGDGYIYITYFYQGG